MWYVYACEREREKRLTERIIKPPRKRYAYTYMDTCLRRNEEKNYSRLTTDSLRRGENARARRYRCTVSVVHGRAFYIIRARDIRYRGRFVANTTEIQLIRWREKRKKIDRENSTVCM